MKFNAKKIVLIVLAIIIGLFIIKDVILKMVIDSVGSKVLGAKVRVGSFGWNMFTHQIHLGNLRVYNPTGFPNIPLVNISDIDVNYDLASIMKGKMYFPYVNVNLKETVILKNEQGKLNVDSLKVAMPKGGKPLDLAIDVMKLNIDRTVYIDNTAGHKPVVKVFDVGLKDKTFKNIKSVNQLATLVIVQGMGPAAIKGAAIYGVATFLGASLFPAGAAMMFVGSDSSSVDYQDSADHVYDEAMQVFQNLGDGVSGDKSSGIIKGKIDGADITVTITHSDKTHVSVGARKMLMPRSELSAGFIYELSQKVN